MNINWMAVGIGFIVTLILGIIGVYVGFLGLLAPIIGGLIAGYMITGNYTDGAINGGLGAGIAGFVVTLIAVLVFGGAAMALSGYEVSGGVIGAAAIIGAIVAFIVEFILGAIGGIIGILIKGQTKPETTA